MVCFQVSALDRDLGPNADLEYSIIDGEEDFKPSQFFDIDLKTGIIRTKHEILGLRKYYCNVSLLSKPKI